MIYIYTDIPSISDADLQKALDRLPDWRREQALRFKHTLGQKECTYSYLMLCEGLKREYGLAVQPHFQIGEHGKPALQECPQIHFNISHCKAGIAVALGDVPVGIDIEAIGRMNDSLARYVLNETEYARMLQSDNPAIEFTKFWTMKEAVAKLTGQGITDHLKQLLSIYNNVEIATEVHAEKGFVLSVAYNGSFNTGICELNNTDFDGKSL